MFFLGFELVHQVAILEPSLRTVRTVARSTRNHSRTGVGFSWSIGHFCAGFILCCKNTSGTGLHKAAPGGCRIGLGASTPGISDEERLECAPIVLTDFCGWPPFVAIVSELWRCATILSRSIEILSLIIGPDKALLRGGQRVRVLRRGGGLIGGSEGEGVRDCYCLTMTRTVVSSRSARLAFIKACVDWKQTITKNAEKCVICGRDLGRDTRTIV